MRVYIAAPKDDVLRAREQAEAVGALDRVRVTSTWHAIVNPGDKDPTDRAEAQQLLEMNYTALAEADVVVALTRDGMGRETYVEIGYALALGKRVIWSIEHGGLSLSYAHDNVIPAPRDADIVRIVRSMAAGWRSAAGRGLADAERDKRDADAIDFILNATRPHTTRPQTTEALNAFLIRLGAARKRLEALRDRLRGGAR